MDEITRRALHIVAHMDYADVGVFVGGDRVSLYDEDGAEVLKLLAASPMRPSFEELRDLLNAIIESEPNPPVPDFEDDGKAPF
ncbi:MAG: hypothetical protein ACK4WC_02950 [Rubrimonas sp.]